MLLRVVFMSSFILATANVPWHQNGIIYQLYPRSFQDSDNDGIGDLKGVMQRVDYLASLGISAVWFSPLYPSPNEDFGYDISNFTDISPEYGTMQDFDDLVVKLREKGIKVMLDFVPNHSSTEHQWFKESEADKNGKYGDYYIWKDPIGYDNNKKPIPPNNWISVMNTGTSWRWSEARKQFYLHNFMDHQADLNYSNPNVIREMEDVLTFWMKHGVSGFRVDAVSWLCEDPEFKDEPPAEHFDQTDPNNYYNLLHYYTMDLPESVGVVKKFRAAVDAYSKRLGDSEERIIVLESYSSLETLLDYYGDEKSPGTTFPFNFQLIFIDQEANSTVWEQTINNYYKNIGNRYTNWVLGNHDRNRIATRWSEEWVDVLHIIMMSLKGTSVTYNGEEIGLEDNIVRWDQAVDMQGISAGQKRFKVSSRDYERGPMPWDASSNAGFSKGKPWLPLAPSYWNKNVNAEEKEERSHLKVYKELSKLRKGMTFTYGDLQVNATDNQLLYITRALTNNPTIVSIVNVGDVWVAANVRDIVNIIPDYMHLLVSSVNYPDYKTTSVDSTRILLPPKSGVVLST